MLVGSSLVFFSLILGYVLAALPEGWKACKLRSPVYEECMKEQITNALSYLKNGNKKLGVMPLDPLRFTTWSLNEGSGPVSINMEMKNMDIKGLSASKIINITNDDWKKLDMALIIPHFEMEGNYSIKGQVLVLPISGNGHASFIVEGIGAKVGLVLEEATKNGVSCYQVNEVATDLTIENAVINFQNLFNGNKPLGDTMNRFLNENWKEIMDDLKPAISKTLGIGCMQYVNQILAKFSIDDINVK